MRRGAAALLAVLVLLGCSGNDDEPADGSGGDAPSATSAEPAPPPAGSPESRPQELIDCLAEQGVDVPGPGEPPPSNIDPLEVQRAVEACSEFLPGGVQPP
jgi:hypothetical protein